MFGHYTTGSLPGDPRPGPDTRDLHLERATAWAARRCGPLRLSRADSITAPPPQRGGLQRPFLDLRKSPVSLSPASSSSTSGAPLATSAPSAEERLAHHAISGVRRRHAPSSSPPAPPAAAAPSTTWPCSFSTFITVPGMGAARRWRWPDAPAGSPAEAVHVQRRCRASPGSSGRASRAADHYHRARSQSARYRAVEPPSTSWPGRHGHQADNAGRLAQRDMPAIRGPAGDQQIIGLHRTIAQAQSLLASAARGQRPMDRRSKGLVARSDRCTGPGDRRRRRRSAHLGRRDRRLKARRHEPLVARKSVRVAPAAKSRCAAIARNSGRFVVTPSMA